MICGKATLYLLAKNICKQLIKTIHKANGPNVAILVLVLCNVASPGYNALILAYFILGLILCCWCL